MEGERRSEEILLFFILVVIAILAMVSQYRWSKNNKDASRSKQYSILAMHIIIPIITYIIYIFAALNMFFKEGNIWGMLYNLFLGAAYIQSVFVLSVLTVIGVILANLLGSDSKSKVENKEH